MAEVAIVTPLFVLATHVQRGNQDSPNVRRRVRKRKLLASTLPTKRPASWLSVMALTTWQAIKRSKTTVGPWMEFHFVRTWTATTKPTSPMSCSKFKAQWHSSGASWTNKKESTWTTRSSSFSTPSNNWTCSASARMPTCRPSARNWKQSFSTPTTIAFPTWQIGLLHSKLHRGRSTPTIPLKPWNRSPATAHTTAATAAAAARKQGQVAAPSCLQAQIRRTTTMMIHDAHSSTPRKQKQRVRSRKHARNEEYLAQRAQHVHAPPALPTPPQPPLPIAENSRLDGPDAAPNNLLLDDSVDAGVSP